MSQIASPYGMRPVQTFGGLDFAGAIRSYPLTVDQAGAFYFGDPVGLSGGQPQVLAASPVAGTVSVNSPIGVFMGCEYQDPIRGFVNAQMFPAHGVQAGYTGVRFKILDYPWAVFKIQANGSVPQTAIGLKTAIVGFGTGNNATGNSSVAASSAVAVTATFALHIVGFPKDPNNAPGDPFTDILVTWNFGTHRLLLGAGL
jgi:hypothetical protein